MIDGRDYVWSFAVMKRPNSAEPSAASRWKIQSECRNLQTDILSARCIVDRLRAQSDPTAIAQVVDTDEVRRLVANVVVVAEFVRSIEAVTDQAS